MVFIALTVVIALGMIALRIQAPGHTDMGADASDAGAVVAQGEAPASAGPAVGLSAGQAVLLGLIEGVTEYLPVSSTGHLAVAQQAMDIGQEPEEKDAADSYAIAIQFGAILAVLGLYRHRFAGMVQGLAGKNTEGRRLALSVVVAFVPSALIGLVFEDVIKDRLFGAWPIVVAWLVGGSAILAVTSWQRRRRRTGRRSLAQLNYADAALIGLAQCVALWPGVSRSLVTILAALAIGLALPTAVEFSFLLGFATLGAATSYETLTNGSTMVEAFGWLSPLVGVVAAFVSACAAITWMVGYLNRHSLAVFGWYRIALGATVSLLLVTGAL